MRKVKRWKYYCDFCKKCGGSSYHILKHERGCTSNPNRTCGLCGIRDYTQVPLEELISFYKESGIERLREVAQNCPACILSTLKATVEITVYSNEHGEWETHSWENEFNFKKEIKTFWDEYNDEQLKDEYP